MLFFRISIKGLYYKIQSIYILKSFRGKIRQKLVAIICYIEQHNLNLLYMAVLSNWIICAQWALYLLYIPVILLLKIQLTETIFFLDSQVFSGCCCLFLLKLSKYFEMWRVGEMWILPAFSALHFPIWIVFIFLRFVF